MKQFAFALVAGLALAAPMADPVSAWSPKPTPHGTGTTITLGSPNKIQAYGQRAGAFDRLSDATTQDLVDRLNNARRVCELVEYKPYMVDCLAARYEAIVRDMPRSGAYQPVRAALSAAAKDLARVVSANRDRDVARTRPRAGGRALTARRLTAIRPETVRSAIAQSERIVTEAQTVLLRSGENAADRGLQFQRIAEALDSSKVLLRSI